MKTVSIIEPLLAKMPTRKKVAAYARVSVESERMKHSLSSQISYYNSLIQNNTQWEFAGVYADYGISGTSTLKRDEFNRMLEDCENGKIDIILTKSIQRFARNTVDLLETVRHLKEIGVEVRFEKESISSFSGDGELMLSILASFAQEESRSISDNVKWGTRKRFEQGIPNGQMRVYGYEWINGQLIIVPEEAEVVKVIYNDYLNGASRIDIEKKFDAMGIQTRQGYRFVDSNIKVILTNITYTGNMLLQKEYVVDPITKKRKKNRGELPQYYVENTHEAIISKEDFDKVQAEMERRKTLGPFGNKSLNLTCFSTKIKCGNCGKSYQRSSRNRKNDSSYKMWICATRRKTGNKECIAKDIPENALKQVCSEVLGTYAFDEVSFAEQIEKIVVIDEDKLVFYFYDGRTVYSTWKSTARTDCWTEERRKAWGELHKNKDTNPNRKRYNEFTGFIKCGKCGSNYRSQVRECVDGTLIRSWYCSAPTEVGCVKHGIKDDTIKTLISEVLCIDKFNESTCSEQLKYAKIIDDEIELFFRDGHSVKRTFKEKKRGVNHTEDYKRYMSEVMKQKWRDKRGKDSNNDTCND